MIYSMNKSNYKDFSVVEIGKLPARAYFIPFRTKEKLRQRLEKEGFGHE